MIITDTVGFIRDLPDELKRAFAATLEELARPTCSCTWPTPPTPRWRSRYRRWSPILDQMEFTDAPRLVVLNKADAASPEVLERLANRYNGVVVSALRPKTLPPLLERIENMVDLAGGWPTARTRQSRRARRVSHSLGGGPIFGFACAWCRAGRCSAGPFGESPANPKTASR